MRACLISGSQNYVCTCLRHQINQFMFIFTEERVVSNLSRVVVIIWCFVVLILTQSCTVSLTSLLTVQKLQPKITDVNELIRRGSMWAIREVLFFWKCCYIGLGFEESKLMGYKSYEEYDNLYSRGSGNGGIAAAFGELRYAKVFLSEYCTKYTAVAPIFQTGGFGFVSSLSYFSVLLMLI